MKKILRPYQGKCISSVKVNLDKGIKNQLIVLATGLGKTFISTNIGSKFKKGLFVAHKEELIEQAKKAFEEELKEPVGIVKAKDFDISKRFTIASVQTLMNRLDKIDSNLFDCIIIDECHHYSSKEWLKSIRHFNPRLRLGLTATPHRADGLSLTSLFEKITFNYDIAKGIADKWLCQLDAVRCKTHIDLTKVKRVAGDFNQKELSAKVDIPERNKMIVDKYIKYGLDRQGIVFCVDIQHAINVCNEFNDKGIKAEFIVSNETLCPDRKERIERYKNGETKVLTNVMILTEGFDHPDTGIIMMARPTQSLTVYLQSIGRGTRLKSEMYVARYGQVCKIIDFVDNTGNHSLVNTWELDKGENAKDKIFVTEENREKLIDAERKRREVEIQTMVDNESVIHLIDPPKAVVSKSAKMEETATEAQIKFLKTLGVYEEEVEYTKGQASEYITHHPANLIQKAYAKKNGYKSETLTIGEYQMIKRRVESSNKYKPMHLRK